jgi:hypothetical protein
MPLELPTLTGPEYVKVRVRPRVPGVDPTSAAVSMCLKVEGEQPAPGDFQAATWETDATGRIPIYRVQLLVSGLTAGNYVAWVKLVSGPETIVRPAPDYILVS